MYLVQTRWKNEVTFIMGYIFLCVLDIAGLGAVTLPSSMWVEGEVGGGGGWGNRLHLTLKLGQLNLDSVLTAH